MSTGTSRRLLAELNATSSDGLKQALVEMLERDNSRSNPEAQLVITISKMLAPLQNTKPEHLYSVVRKAVVKVSAFRWVGLELEIAQLLAP